jgi:hypothetical protein
MNGTQQATTAPRGGPAISFESILDKAYTLAACTAPGTENPTMMIRGVPPPSFCPNKWEYFRLWAPLLEERLKDPTGRFPVDQWDSTGCSVEFLDLPDGPSLKFRLPTLKSPLTPSGGTPEPPPSPGADPHPEVLAKDLNKIFGTPALPDHLSTIATATGRRYVRKLWGGYHRAARRQAHEEGEFVRFIDFQRVMQKRSTGPLTPTKE